MLQATFILKQRDIEMDGGLEHFLEKNRISKEVWGNSKCSWDELCRIRDDHRKNTPMLAESAALYANLIQKISGVHSVRWRIKDADHLLEKIIRKRVVHEEKYLNIDANNYYEVITDLIGIRALHLFKNDCFDINNSLSDIWEPSEKPVAYIREGDPAELIKKYEESGLEVKVHPAGYRSVHYVIASRPLKRTLFAEIQVRTIFEEGWSEIDHKIRYPNFSSNELVGYFLTIFNRMSGSADEMGTFVKGLTASIENFQSQISAASFERDEGLKAMEEMLVELEGLKQQDNASKDTIKKLKNQVSTMKQSAASSNNFGLASVGLDYDWMQLGGSIDAAKNAMFAGLGASSMDEVIRKQYENILGLKNDNKF